MTISSRALALARSVDPLAEWAWDDDGSGLPCNTILCTDDAARRVCDAIPGAYPDGHPHPAGMDAVVIPDEVA